MIESVQKAIEHIDPKTIFSALAIIIAFFAFLASRRATKVAARAQAEHGKLRDVRMELCGLHFDLQRGSLVARSAPWPELGSPHVTTLAVYGGPDPLSVERLMLTVIYTRGKLLRTCLLLTLDIKDPDLRVSGPDIPVTVDAYHKVTWQLPELLIPQGIYKRELTEAKDLRPGVYFSTPFEELKFLVAADYGGSRYRATTMRYGMMLPVGIRRETRPIRTMSKFMIDPGVPPHIKRLFEQWHVAAAPQSSPATPRKTGAAKRRSRRRQ